MPDMLVNLLRLPPVEPALEELRSRGLSVRRARPWELRQVREFVAGHFSDSWADEISVGLVRQPVTVFVAAQVSETGEVVYEYGHYETLPNGTNNQVGDGAPDSGQVVGNQIVFRVPVASINAIAGTNVVGTTSTGTSANAQILIGASATGGLLLSSDTASGSDFVVK